MESTLLVMLSSMFVCARRRVRVEIGRFAGNAPFFSVCLFVLFFLSAPKAHLRETDSSPLKHTDELLKSGEKKKERKKGKKRGKKTR